MAGQYLESLIALAGGGNPDALAELSTIALGGNETARLAIQQLDSGEWKPVANGVVQAIVWPGQAKEGWKGPQKGDVPLHNEV
mgnify:CR=1 FL=1